MQTDLQGKDDPARELPEGERLKATSCWGDTDEVRKPEEAVGTGGTDLIHVRSKVHGGEVTE